MSLTQQYALDLYRLARHQQITEPGPVPGPGPGPVRPEALPPVPGTHEARLLHALWAGLRFRARLRRTEQGRTEQRRTEQCGTEQGQA